MDKYRIDQHKLIYHPERVSEWLKGDSIYPIYIEISPVNQCNHRCTFCSFNYTGYRKKNLDTSTLKINLENMAKCGVKAIMYAGEGEPLIHPDIVDIIAFTNLMGLDAAVTTNGVLMDKKFLGLALRNLSWIKVSIDAGTPETHAKIHGTKESDFGKIMQNLKDAVEIRNKNGYDCVIGTQAILLEDNWLGMEDLAETLKDIGVDYLALKPYTSHPYKKDNLNMEQLEELWNWFDPEPIESFSNYKFKVIVRYDTFEKQNKERDYDTCNALDFCSYIDSSGDVYPCFNFLGNKEYVYGNINKHIFKEIWDNRNSHNVDVTECRKICRMDKINSYLDNLKNEKIEHVNFI